MLKWLVQIFPETTCKVNNDGRSAFDGIKMNRLYNYKEITNLYKNHDLYKCNKELIKRRKLSHAWDLPGHTWLVTRETEKIFKKIPLEGHLGAQWFHILGKNLELFKLSYPNLMNDFDAKLYKDFFDIGANLKSISLESKLERIKKGLPTGITAGFYAHLVMLLVWEKQIVICNRGASSRHPLEIYHFDPKKLNLNHLNRILKISLYGTSLEYEQLLFEFLPKELLFKQTDLDIELQTIASSLPLQTVGNCSFISPITAFYAIHLIAEVRKIQYGAEFYLIENSYEKEDRDGLITFDSSSEEENSDGFVTFDSSSEEENYRFFFSNRKNNRSRRT